MTTTVYILTYQVSILYSQNPKPARYPIVILAKILLVKGQFQVFSNMLILIWNLKSKNMYHEFYYILFVPKNFLLFKFLPGNLVRKIQYKKWQLVESMKQFTV
jgi:hypothetical protein